MDDSFPLDLRFLEIDEQAQSPLGGPQIVETLCEVFIGETLNTFQLENEHIFGENICKAITRTLALVSHGKWDFGTHPKTTKATLLKQSTLLDLLQEMRTQSIGCPEHRPLVPARSTPP